MILVPASPDARGDQLDPLGRYTLADDCRGLLDGAAAMKKRKSRGHSAQRAQGVDPKNLFLRLGQTDDDDVFQQKTSSAIKKSPKRAKVADAAAECEPEEGGAPESASQCTICLDSWQSSGAHRVCCLKCGHLFGRSCIERWLRTSKACPICKAKAQRAHIRPLFVQHVGLVAVDDGNEAERQRLARLVAEAEAKREHVVRAYRVDLERLHLECQAHRQQVERLKRELDEERTKRLHLQRMAMQTIQSGLSVGAATNASSAFLAAVAHGPASRGGSKSSSASTSPVGAATSPASASTSPVSAASMSSTTSTPTLSTAPRPSLAALRACSSSEIVVDAFDDLPDVAQLGWNATSGTTTTTTATTPTCEVLPLATTPFRRKLNTVHKLPLRRSRVLDISGEGNLLASVVTGGAGPGTRWGLVKMSLLDPANHQETIAGLHDKQIRDIKCGVLGTSSENLVLTASEDKVLHIVSLRTNSSVQTVTLEAGAWACEWDRNDPNYLYCGVRNALCVYDIRKPAVALARHVPHTGTSQIAPTSEVTQPLHSLCFLPAGAVGAGAGKALLAASCGGVFRFDAGDGGQQHEDQEWRALHVPLTGVCSSVSYDHESRHCTASFRSSPHYAKQSHNVFTWEGESARVHEVRSLYSISPQTLLSRSTLFSFVDGGGEATPLGRRLLLAAGAEMSNTVALWDVASGQQVIHHLAQHSSPVMDVRHYTEGDGLFLASLSEQQLFLHSIA